MSRMQNRIDLPAEINACERIWAFDESRLNLELSKVGVDLEKLTQWFETDSDIRAPIIGSSLSERQPQRAEQLHRGTEARSSPNAASYDPTPAAPTAAMTANAARADMFELAGRMKFFDARRGFGFFVADDGQGDVLVHILHLRDAGYQTAHEGARVHAIVQRMPKGLQVARILSVDESSAIHPSQLPQRTREKVHAESDWVRVKVKWYNCEKGYGFVHEDDNSPDCMVHADTLRRWGVAPLWPKQVVEIRWGMTPKGRMVAEIRHLHGLPGHPPVH